MIGGLMKNLRVIEVGASYSVGYCGRLLQALGAEVVSVEPPWGLALRQAEPTFADSDGNERSAAFSYLAAGKKSVAIDLSSKDGALMLEDLISNDAIVLLEGGQEALGSSGLTNQGLRSKFPGLIVGSITRFGEDGPYSKYRGGDFQAQALGGLMHMVGHKTREPLRLGGHQAMYDAALCMLVGVAAALYRRQKNGQGAELSTSLLEAVAYIEWKSYSQFQHDGTRMSRGGSAGPFILRCKDGHSAFYYRDRNWPIVREMFPDERLADPKFETQKGRDANRQELQAILNEHTRDRSKQDIYKEAQARGMPVGYAATMEDLLASEHYRSREFIAPIFDADSTTAGMAPGAPWTVNGQRPAPGATVPNIGQHTDMLSPTTSGPAANG